MRKLVLAALALLILAATVSAADARRRHYRYYVKHAPVMLVVPGLAEARSSRGRIAHPAQLIPRDWQLQPPDARWQGRRYFAPDGSAWLAFYATNAANDAQARFQAVAFGDGEQVTYLHGTRDRLTVSGLKGDRIYYRKVVLACGGTAWRHLALEYPADAKFNFDRFVARLSHGFDRLAEEDCGGDLFTAPQPASAPPAPKPEGEKPPQPN